MTAAIEWDKLGELVIVAPVAGLVVAVTFALVILGFARAEEARRDEAGGAAVVYGALALLAFGAFLATVVFGIAVIVSK
jgi:hypothetical protein